MKRCVQCDGRSLVKGESEHTIEIGVSKVTVLLPSVKCENCGEGYVSGEVVEQAELKAGVALADIGVCTKELLRFLRKALGMRGADLAELLGVRLETVSRWETGATSFDRAVISTLADLACDRFKGQTTTEDRLRAMQKPPPPQTLRIDLRSVREAA